MTIDQQMLGAHLTARLRAARPELAAVGDPAAARDLVDADGGGVAAVVVARGFDPAALVVGACSVAALLDGAAASAWRHEFSRTVFLCGDPARLAARHHFVHVSPGGTAAWTLPAPAARTRPLRRLLKAFAGTRPLVLPAAPPTTLPGRRGDRAARHVRLHVATAGRTVLDGMVAIHHVVAEAVLDGLLGPEDQVTLAPAPRLTGVADPFLALRVGPDPFDGDRLTAVAGLTEEAQ